MLKAINGEESETNLDSGEEAQNSGPKGHQQRRRRCIEEKTKHQQK